MIYEIINPSDCVTFEADNDLIAEYCCLIVGEGKYFLKNERGESIGELLLFANEDRINKYLLRFGPLDKFLADHKQEIIKAFESFLTMKGEERKDYLLALSLIDDPEKRKKYQAEVQDRRRSSMNDITGRAWEWAGKIKNTLKEEGLI